MPRYPIDSAKLLEAADALAPPELRPGRPPYTHHRRAVSTAYYAVFHAITYRVASTVFPTADEAFQRRVRRWIGHADVRTVAQWVSRVQGTLGGTAPEHIAELIAPAGEAPHIDSETVLIADGFRELNERREQADYEHDAIFTRADARGNIELARQTVSVTEQTGSDAAMRFFGLIAMQAKIQPR